jgi:integrase
VLSYDIERHAKEIYSKLAREWLLKAGPHPTENEILELGRAAVRLAETFSRSATKLKDADSTPEPQRSVCVFTLEQLFLEWQQRGLTVWQRKDAKRLNTRFQRFIFPSLGPRPAAEIQPFEIVAALRKVEDAGYLASAHILLAELQRLYRFAISTGYLGNNPTTDVRTALHRRRVRGRATILLPRRIGELLRAVESYRGNPVSKYFLKLLPLVIVRIGELRLAQWSEINLKKSEWRIPASRMKARRPHIVPLSLQVKSVLKDLHKLTGYSKYVFASSSSTTGYITDRTFSGMLASVGFSGEMTSTGLRSMAATFLSERGWRVEAIERQLSHADPVRLRRSYVMAEYLPERRKMMQAWADHLDRLRLDKKRLNRRQSSPSLIDSST